MELACSWMAIPPAASNGSGGIASRPPRPPRDIHDEQKRLLYEDGINPSAVSLDWHATKTAGTWTERHSDDVLKKLNKDILPAIGGLAIDAITAQGCPGVISQVLDDAVATGHCTINPAHSLKRHAPVKQTTSHDPCIPWSEEPLALGPSGAPVSHSLSAESRPSAAGGC